MTGVAPEDVTDVVARTLAGIRKLELEEQASQEQRSREAQKRTAGKGRRRGRIIPNG